MPPRGPVRMPWPGRRRRGPSSRSGVARPVPPGRRGPTALPPGTTSLATPKVFPHSPSARAPRPRGLLRPARGLGCTKHPPRSAGPATAWGRAGVARRPRSRRPIAPAPAPTLPLRPPSAARATLSPAAAWMQASGAPRRCPALPIILPNGRPGARDGAWAGDPTLVPWLAARPPPAPGPTGPRAPPPRQPFRWRAVARGGKGRIWPPAPGRTDRMSLPAPHRTPSAGRGLGLVASSSWKSPAPAPTTPARAWKAPSGSWAGAATRARRRPRAPAPGGTTSIR
mmetsp:Transcript_68264/g.215955  ORF Transcript_68264/g.215955 Transcript_68264/m.215955 type:complete len:283 (+) Transcript_68264:1153-2001(+)